MYTLDKVFKGLVLPSVLGRLVDFMFAFLYETIRLPLYEFGCK